MISPLILLAALPLGCDDTLFGAPTEPLEGDGWCAVEQLLASDCASCHSGAAALGGLDLSGDPHAALVGVESAQYPGQVLVTPGDADASLLYTKMADTQPADAGGPMPPGAPVSGAALDAVRAWVEAGASGVCDTDDGDGGGGGDRTDGADTGGAPEGWCLVQAALQRECLACHSASSAMGDLDLETDAHAALVGAPSAATGALLVAPGDRDGSLLWRKLQGTQASGEGGVMPPAGALDDAILAPIGQWIDDGASSDCDDPVEDTGGATGRYHPDGWADAAQHGYGAKHGELPCTNCHGEDLQGGLAGVSCDSCHDAGWRSDCTFCHGGTDNASGAPPRDIDGQSATGTLSFQAHTAHVTATPNHAAFACAQCHDTPANALTPGHVLLGDTTPGQAEVRFAGGLSPAATWSGLSCSNLYCHGHNGDANGTMAHDAATPTCEGCHAGPASGESDQRNRLSGEHEEHLDRGATCADCHGAMVSAGGAITNAALHVNGAVDLALPSGVTFSGTTCTGTCHIADRTERHAANPW